MLKNLREDIIILIELICLVLLENGLKYKAYSAPCDILGGFTGSARFGFDENAHSNSLLYNLPFEGDKTQISEIKFKSNELNDTILNEYFELRFKQLFLKNQYDLDEIQIDLIELIFTCTSSSSTNSMESSSQIANPSFSSRSTFLLYVTVNDVNDNRPEFIGVPYKFSIKELTPVGSIVYQSIKAIDKDMPNKPNSQISFSIPNGPCSDYFEFPLTTKSDLSLVKLIHFDAFSKCDLIIKVEDHGSPQLSSITTIQINVIDVDDKDPAFTKNLYLGSIRRNSLTGSLVNMSPNSEIKAYDQDFGINMTIKYSLTSNPNEMFEIDESNGKIKLKNSIDDYDRSEYSLIVKGSQTDNPLKSALIMVNIKIIDVNEYPPNFERNVYEAKVKENAKMGTFVCNIHAIDLDKNRIEYSISNNHELPFFIDKYLGIIKVNGRLDYEMKAKYVFEVFAKDGNFTDTATVYVDLINIVDKAPFFEFNNYNFKIKLPYDVYIGQVRAIDAEKSGNLKYSLKFNNLNESNLFCISQNGIIFICPSDSSTASSSSVTLSNNYASNSTNKFGRFSLSDEELLTKITNNEYSFNVSASVYSNDLMETLENHVECQIKIESRFHENDVDSDFQVQDGSNISTAYPKSNLFTISSPSYLNERLFKDSTTVIVFVAVILGVIVLLIFCTSATIWLKCHKSTNKKRQRLKNMKNPMINKQIVNQQFDYEANKTLASLRQDSPLKYQQGTVNGGASVASGGVTGGVGSFGFLPSRVNNCCHSNCNSSRCSDCNSCKNSTSGVSCSSGSTNFNNGRFKPNCDNLDSKLLSERHQQPNQEHLNAFSLKSSDKKAFEVLKWEEKNNIQRLDEEMDIDDGSPVSKVTILSDYLTNQRKLIKLDQNNSSNNTKGSSNLTMSGDLEQIRVSSYSDILSSAASTLKNRETPILIRQENIYDVENYEDGDIVNDLNQNQSLNGINRNSNYLQYAKESSLSSNCQQQQIKGSNSKLRKQKTFDKTTFGLVSTISNGLSATKSSAHTTFRQSSPTSCCNPINKKQQTNDLPNNSSNKGVVRIQTNGDGSNIKEKQHLTSVVVINPKLLNKNQLEVAPIDSDSSSCPYSSTSNSPISSNEPNSQLLSFQQPHSSSTDNSFGNLTSRGENIYKTKIPIGLSKSNRIESNAHSTRLNTSNDINGANSSINLIFNHHEPLSANSETNFENEMMKAEKSSIYEDIRLNNTSKIDLSFKELNDDNETKLKKKMSNIRENSFRNHLDTCNNSLAKLVSLIKNKSTNTATTTGGGASVAPNSTCGTSATTTTTSTVSPNSNKSNLSENLNDCARMEKSNDSSLISVSIDRFTDYDESLDQPTTSDSFISNITPLSISYRNEKSSKDYSILSSSSTSPSIDPKSSNNENNSALNQPTTYSIEPSKQFIKIRFNDDSNLEEENDKYFKLNETLV